MTRQQAYAMLDAMASVSLAGFLALGYDQVGLATYSVSFDPAKTYDGAALDAIAQYCKANSLSLTVKVEAMGVV